MSIASMASRSPTFFRVDNTSNSYIRKSASQSARRSACDRCRAYKLRCVWPSDEIPSPERNEASLMPCARCVKAGVECVRVAHARRSPTIRPSGYERRLARPPPLSPPASNQSANNRRTFVSGVVAKSYPDKSASLSVYSSPLSAHPSREDCTTGQMPSTVSPMEYQHSNVFAPSSSDAPAMSTKFPPLLPMNRDERTGPDVSYGLGEFDLEMMTSGSLLDAMLDDDLASANRNGEPGEPTDDQVRDSDQNVRQVKGTTGATTCSKTKGPPKTRHECLHRLSRLNLKLLDCLSAAEDHPIALEDILAYQSPCDTPETKPCKNIIGFLLESSQEFLDAVEGLKDLMERQEKESSYDSNQNSEDFLVDSLDTSVFFNNQTRNKPQNDDGDTIYSQFSGTTLHPPGGENMPGSTTSSHPRRPGGHCSGPTTLTIMTCYIWLFHGYEAVFAAIHDSLLSQNQRRKNRRTALSGHEGRIGDPQDAQQMSPQSKSRKTDLATSLLPNVRIGGFQLDGHPHLQIEMLIYISCRILNQMESVLGIKPKPADSDTTESGTISIADREKSFLDPRCTPTLLRSLLCAADGDEDDCSTSAPTTLIEGIVKKIRRMLDIK
ncbi:Putative zn(2)Cys(6) fungal-type DNA-binding domain-containing protein [Colletotrichum destructivum]|uniref:Zn(2)Cys(6) fungal-type DNA-binding domain-containing protein n=1 Tax=Colletotrichum destructivum TaxID=34406 RepID=A0AAX4IBY1_9PEZI|nr:Putative zn(2)Cys(6) fungal-type DNA-binding domain-containing protein [Colletotrichum destructivum]